MAQRTAFLLRALLGAVIALPFSLARSLSVRDPRPLLTRALAVPVLAGAVAMVLAVRFLGAPTGCAGYTTLRKSGWE